MTTSKIWFHFSKEDRTGLLLSDDDVSLPGVVSESQDMDNCESSGEVPKQDTRALPTQKVMGGGSALEKTPGRLSAGLVVYEEHYTIVWDCLETVSYL